MFNTTLNRMTISKKLIITIVPAITLIWGIATLILFDSFSSRTIDSEYTYLINGLNCSQLHFNWIGHTDNPGTPLQIYNGIIIQLTHLLAGKGTLVKDVFSRPDFYMNAISLSMVLFHVLILLCIGRIGLKREIPTWQLIILQAGSFFNDVIFWLFLRVTPDRFFVIAVFLFILVYLKYGYQNYSSRKFAIYSGVAMACGFAIKFNFLPLLILPVFMIKSKEEKLIYSGVGIASYFIFVAPIITRFDDYFRFVKGMFFNQGSYGGGEAGIMNVSEIIRNIGENFSINPELALLLLVLIILFLLAFKRSETTDASRFTWIFAGYLIVFTLQIILVSKHFKNYYQAPVFALYALIFFTITEFLSTTIKRNKQLLSLSLILPVLFLALNAFKIKHDAESILKEKLQRERVLAFVKNNIKPEDYWFVEPCWESAPYQENGLVFGLSYCGHRVEYLPDLMKVNPNIITYEGKSEPVKLWRGLATSLDSVLATGKNIHIYSTSGRNAIELKQMLLDAATRNNFQLDVDTIFSDSESKKEIIRIKATNSQTNWTPLNAINESRQTRINRYIDTIKNTPDWLEKVKKKAIEKNIPLDSMIKLDAIWMADQNN